MPTPESSLIVCSRTEFDRRLRNNTNLEASIAGFSTLSLTSLLQAKTESGFSVPLFGLSFTGVGYADLHSDVYERTFGFPPNYYRGYRELMLVNRRCGKSSALAEYLINVKGVTDGRDIRFDPLLDLVMNHAKKPAQLIKELAPFSLLSEAERLGIQDEFPEECALTDALVALRSREGVQVIYGDKDSFTEFLKQTGATENDDCAAWFYSPIPPELVKAVIPLGSYEKKALGVLNQKSCS